MERLTDIIDKDLHDIFYYYRDFTYQITLQGGSESISIMASMQADTKDFDASQSPLNAYALTVYMLESDLTEGIRKAISKNAVIYINNIAHKVVDTTIDMGRLRRIAVEKHSARGNLTTRPIGGE
jgi:hypothetical protein